MNWDVFLGILFASGVLGVIVLVIGALCWACDKIEKRVGHVPAAVFFIVVTVVGAAVFAGMITP